MNKTISIVIPAYNVEGCIGKCLDSVLSQTYGELEVIVVNDGSCDNTAGVVQQHKHDSRLLYIEQENAGVSAARNRGIDMASGEYIGFIDSDDYIEPEMYEMLLNAILQADADISVCDFNLVYDDRTQLKYSGMRDETVDVQNDIFGYFCKYCACPKPNNYIWTRLYKAELIKKLPVRFENFKVSDDTLFNFKLLPHIRRATFVSKGFYNYYQRSDSNVYTAAKKENLAVVYADTFDALADYYEKNAPEEYMKCLPIHAFSRLRSVFFYSRLAKMSEQEIISNIMTGFEGRKIAGYLTGAAV